MLIPPTYYFHQELSIKLLLGRYTTNSLQPFLIKSSKSLGDQYCTMVLKTESPSRLDRDGKNFMLQFYDVLSCKNTSTSKEQKGVRGKFPYAFNTNYKCFIQRNLAAVSSSYGPKTSDSNLPPIFASSFSPIRDPYA